MHRLVTSRRCERSLSGQTLPFYLYSARREAGPRLGSGQISWGTDPVFLRGRGPLGFGAPGEYDGLSFPVAPVFERTKRNDFQYLTTASVSSSAILPERPSLGLTFRTTTRRGRSSPKSAATSSAASPAISRKTRAGRSSSWMKPANPNSGSALPPTRSTNNPARSCRKMQAPVLGL